MRSDQSSNRESVSDPISSTVSHWPETIMLCATASPYMNPAQAALISNAPARSAPMASCTRLATLGIPPNSGLNVQTITRSMCAGWMSAVSMAACAACSASDAVVSRGPAMRRARMPVRVRIHSSEVETNLTQLAIRHHATR